MLKRISLLLAISLHTLMWGGVTSEAASQTSPKGFSLADVFKLFQIPISKVSSSDLLKALGKFLPVHFQKGISTSGVSGCPYHIGDFAQGGVIIYLTHDGMHGLVAAIEDASPVGGLSWQPEDKDTPTSATNNDPLPFATPSIPYGQYYGGYLNQQAIPTNDLNQFPAFKAAAEYSITVNGVTYDDWWLPSSRELSLMYALVGVINKVSIENKGSAMSTGVENSVYWSSLEYDKYMACSINFYGGYLYNDYKTLLSAVRCVRAF